MMSDIVVTSDLVLERVRMCLAEAGYGQVWIGRNHTGGIKIGKKADLVAMSDAEFRAFAAAARKASLMSGQPVPCDACWAKTVTTRRTTWCFEPSLQPVADCWTDR